MKREFLCWVKVNRVYLAIVAFIFIAIGVTISSPDFEKKSEVVLVKDKFISTGKPTKLNVILEDVSGYAFLMEATPTEFYQVEKGAHTTLNLAKVEKGLSSAVTWIVVYIACLVVCVFVWFCGGRMIDYWMFK
jgi:hypothetical protein